MPYVHLVNGLRHLGLIHVRRPEVNALHAVAGRLGMHPSCVVLQGAQALNKPT